MNILKLNSNDDDPIFMKLKERFNTTNQQLFINNYYMYNKYDKKNDYVVDLDDVYEEIGFINKGNAKRLLEKYFKIDIDYKVFLRSEENLNGGKNKQQIMMNVVTFKKFCMRANTKEAEKIHDYYIDMEEIILEYTSEQLELKKKEMELKDDRIKTIYKDKASERHGILLKQFASSGPLVYIIKVHTINTDEYVIKIGESRVGIENRFNEHNKNYDEALILDCFSVQNSKKFERFIHTHQDIKKNKVNNLLDHEKENELFHIGTSLSYSHLLSIINKNLKYYNCYNCYDIEKQIEMEDKKIKLQELLLKNKEFDGNSINVTDFSDIYSFITTKMDELKSDIKSDIDDLRNEIKELKAPIKTTNNFNETLKHIGDRLQKINPETYKLVKVYETMTDCINEDDKNKRSSILQAVANNTIYNNFRWNTVNRELDPTIVNIQPTKITKVQNLGYIAKLNSEKTEILNVYIDRKTAALDNNYNKDSALDDVVKKHKISNNHYYSLYDSCADDIKEQFIIKMNGIDNGIPETKYPKLYKNGVGKYTGDWEMVAEYKTKFECWRTEGFSDKTLNKAIESQKMHNGYYYKDLNAKVKCL